MTSTDVGPSSTKLGRGTRCLSRHSREAPQTQAGTTSSYSSYGGGGGSGGREAEKAAPALCALRRGGEERDAACGVIDRCC